MVMMVQKYLQRLPFQQDSGLCLIRGLSQDPSRNQVSQSKCFTWEEFNEGTMKRCVEKVKETNKGLVPKDGTNYSRKLSIYYKK